MLFLSSIENQSIKGSSYKTVSTIGAGIENISPNTTQNALTQLATNTVKELLVDFHPGKANTTMLSGSPANEIKYSGKTSEGNDAKGLRIWKVKSTYLYIITFLSIINDPIYATNTATDAAVLEFERQLPIVKHMIDPFEITK